MSQRDAKRLVTYSSISHLGFIMLGVFALTPVSTQGAVLIMINHGIATSALFLLLGMLHDRQGTTELGAFDGLARAMPIFSVMLSLAILSAVALPATNGFVGEFLVLVGSYEVVPVLTLVASTGAVFAAIYGLRMLQGVIFERGNLPRTEPLRDLNRREMLVMGVFALAIVWMGVAPGPVLRRVERASRGTVEAARFGLNAPLARVPGSVRPAP
jgi:NADH-quinone oxidoreductase subunit M